MIEFIPVKVAKATENLANCKNAKGPEAARGKKTLHS
jgi:hypothetical protein